MYKELLIFFTKLVLVFKLSIISISRQKSNDVKIVTLSKFSNNLAIVCIEIYRVICCFVFDAWWRAASIVVAAVPLSQMVWQHNIMYFISVRSQTVETDFYLWYILPAIKHQGFEHLVPLSTKQLRASTTYDEWKKSIFPIEV